MAFPGVDQQDLSSTVASRPDARVWPRQSRGPLRYRLAALEQVAQALRECLRKRATQRARQGRSSTAPARRSRPQTPTKNMTSAGPCRPCPGSTSLAALLICESLAQRQAKRWLNLAALLVLAPGGDVVLDVGDVVLDHERTLAQRGILAGACLSLKTAGLLGGGGHSKLSERAAVADASAGGGAQRSKFVAELSTAESTGLKRPLDLLASRAETQHTAALKAQRAAAALTNARLNDENGRLSPQPPCSRMHTGFRA